MSATSTTRAMSAGSGALEVSLRRATDDSNVRFRLTVGDRDRRLGLAVASRPGSTARMASWAMIQVTASCGEFRLIFGTIHPSRSSNGSLVAEDIRFDQAVVLGDGEPLARQGGNR